MTPKLRLISHKLCPYVQRAVIVATEKNIPFERVDIDLADKPEWFLAISPTGKTPVLEVTTQPGGRVVILFESAVIAEYLDEISGASLLPQDSLDRAWNRSWVEFASTTLNSIGKFYAAPDRAAFENSREELLSRLGQVERETLEPWFNGPRFGLVDAAFGPALRYLEVFQAHGGMNPLANFPKTAAWSKRLLERASVQSAVSADYPKLLVEFVRKKGSCLADVLQNRPLAA
jgi:glutathione S-transferase